MGGKGGINVAGVVKNAAMHNKTSQHHGVFGRHVYHLIMCSPETFTHIINSGNCATRFTILLPRDIDMCFSATMFGCLKQSSHHS